MAPFDAAVKVDAPPKKAPFNRHKAKCYVVDFETKSELDVTEVGAVRYSEHHSTEILCLGYKVKGVGLRKLWTPAFPFPTELLEAIEAGDVIFEAHNAMFECAIWLNILRKRHGVPMPSRWTDTMATCAYRALPMSLAQVGDYNVLDLKTKKNKHGKFLLQKLSQPRKPTKKEKKDWKDLCGEAPMPTLWTDGSDPIPEAWLDDTENPCPKHWTKDTSLFEALCDYCLDDVTVEEMLGDVVGDLTDSEYKLWVLDQKINWRGVYVDMKAVDCALHIVHAVEAKLNAELPMLTGGAIDKGTQAKRIKDWANSLGEELKDLKKETVEESLKSSEAFQSEINGRDEDIDDGGSDDLGYEESDEVEELEAIADISKLSNAAKVRRVLQIRQQTSLASTKKLHRIMECVCSDGRLRGLLQYHGALSGRWAGRLAQPHNFPRGNKKFLSLGIENLIAAIKTRDPELIELCYGDPIAVVASALRGMFIAAPGKILRVSDFSSIEARVTMMLAGQMDALEAFEKYDADPKNNPDIYCVMAAKLYNRPISKKDDKERQLGKITILGCGYGLGYKKMIFQAWKDYKVRLDDETAKFLVDGYRKSYDQVPACWAGIEQAAKLAIENPGRAYSYSLVTYKMEFDNAGPWLTCELPNGRKLWYFKPSVEPINKFFPASGKSKWIPTIHYWGRNNKQGGRWGQVTNWGGGLVENIVQAIARDIMAEAMVRVERAGYPIILTVHDEIISECDPAHGSQHEFESLMKQRPQWLPECPVNVEGWADTRYQKR